MVASLVVVALVGTDFAAADWLRCLRRTFSDITSLTAEFTLTHTKPGCSAEKTTCRLRLARDPVGRRVGDLTVWAGGEVADRYTLWAGKVYHANPASRQLLVYKPADDDPLRFAAEHLQPALSLLTSRPPAVRMNGGDQHYFFVRLPHPNSRRVRSVDLAVPSGHWPHIPADVPSYVRVCDDGGGCWVTEAILVRVNADNGPTAGDFADPTVVPAGWRVRHPSEEIEEAWKAAERYAAEDRAQQRK